MATELAKLYVVLGLSNEGLNKGLRQARKDLQEFAKEVAVLGAAITAGMGLAVKSAEAELVGINQLSQALRNVGQDYNALKGEIEGVIEAQQKATNFGDEEQREALSQLLYTTGDYQKSLEQLPLVLDLAAAKQMDLGTAAEVIGRVMQGNTTILSRYGIQLEEGATSTEALQMLMEAFGGSAEAMASPFTQLKNILGDLVQKIGAALLPTVRSIVDAITPVVWAIKDWMEAHPELTKVIAIGVAVFGVLAASLGAILLVIPKIIAIKKQWIVVQGLLNTVLNANPIGLIILAVAALIAIVVALIANWEKVKDFFYNLWQNIKILFAEAVKFITDTILLPWIWQVEKIIAPVIQAIGKVVGIFKKDWGDAITEVGDKLANMKENIQTWADGIEDSARAAKEAASANKELKDSVEGVGEALSEIQSKNIHLDITGYGNLHNMHNLGYDVSGMGEMGELISRIPRTSGSQITNITVQGSVIAESELWRKTQQQGLKYKDSNYDTGF